MAEQIEPARTPQVNQLPVSSDGPHAHHEDRAVAGDTSGYQESESTPLEALSPAETVALHRYALGVYDQEAGANPMLDAIEERIGASLYDWVGKEIDKLAETDVPRLVTIATAFADSPLPGDRIELGYQLVAVVTKAAPAEGVELWRRLLRDREAEVRERAYDMLGEVTNGKFSGDADFREKTGMTREDTASLIEAYQRAERNENIFDLGEVALWRVVDLLEDYD